MRGKIRVLLAAAVAFSTSSMALAQATRSAPTTNAPASTMPADAVALTATITSVKGVVKTRANEGAAWVPATVGLKLDQGAEIRTGLRSAVQFTIGDDQTITLDRLGTVTVLQAFQTQGKATTDLGLKYGRTRYDIKDTDLQHESTIRSPGSTLAIRGTDVVYEDQAPWVPQAVSREGRAEFRNYRRQSVAFGGAKRAKIAADKNSPAQVALVDTKNDPKGAFAGRTEAEDEQNLTLTSIGGADARQRELLEPLGLTTPGATGIVNVESLTFFMGWQSTAATPGLTNVDLIVTDPLGNMISALNPVVGTGSDRVVHVIQEGFPGLGSEFVQWEFFAPPGTYNILAQHQGGDVAQVTVEVTSGTNSDVVVGRFGIDPDPPIVLQPGESFTGTVQVGSSASSSRAAAKAAQRAQRAAVRQANRLAKAARLRAR
jgi:hypothetical protein